MIQLSTFEMCKTLIQNNRYEKEKMTQNLDIFLLGDRIKQEEYNELIAMMNPINTINSN